MMAQHYSDVLKNPGGIVGLDNTKLTRYKILQHIDVRLLADIHQKPYKPD